MSKFYLFAGMHDSGLNGAETFQGDYSTLESIYSDIRRAHYEWANVATVKGGKFAVYALYQQSISYHGLMRVIRHGCYIIERETIETIEEVKQRWEPKDSEYINTNDPQSGEWVNI